MLQASFCNCYIGINVCVYLFMFSMRECIRCTYVCVVRMSGSLSIKLIQSIVLLETSNLKSTCIYLCVCMYEYMLYNLYMGVYECIVWIRWYFRFDKTYGFSIKMFSLDNPTIKTPQNEAIKNLQVNIWNPSEIRSGPHKWNKIGLIFAFKSLFKTNYFVLNNIYHFSK